MVPSHSTMSASRLSRTACLLLCLPPCLVGCFAPRARHSAWPPKDFYIEVKAGENSADGIFTKQKVQIWRDGLVVYQEAARPALTSRVKDAPGLPVFKSLCAYRLAGRSVRMLSRLLYQSSVQDIPVTVGDLGGGLGPWLKMLYQSRSRPPDDLRAKDPEPAERIGEPREIMVHLRVFGPMNRVLHIVNSFLPEGHGFSMPEMVGMPEPFHAVEVPAVIESVEGSLRFHLELLKMERFSEAAASKDPRLRLRRNQLQRDTFALACVQGDIAAAEECFRELAEVLKDDAGPNRLFPDTDVDHVEHLRQILVAAKRASATEGGRSGRDLIPQLGQQLAQPAMDPARVTQPRDVLAPPARPRL